MVLVVLISQEWITVTMDGLPFLIAVSIIKETVLCLACAQKEASDGVRKVLFVLRNLIGWCCVLVHFMWR